MQVNCSDTQLRSNLEHAKSLNLPELKVHEPHTRVLAIVGSGPSLKDFWQFIPPDCDVMALNGAYRFLLSQGRIPHFFAMLDARDCNISFLSLVHTESKFLLASQCHPHIFESCESLNAEIFHLSTPTTKAVFPDAEVMVGGGGTIGLTSLALAVAYGYRTVMLYGFDSSFEDGKSHCLEQPHNVGLKEIDVWVEDRKYRTTHAMAQQTMDFFPFYDAIKKTVGEFSIHLFGRGLFYDFVQTNNNPTSRERELAKYVEAYKHDDYGMTEERRKGLRQILAGALVHEYVDTYLDVSTGRGESLELAQDLGYVGVWGTETVEALCGSRVKQAVLPKIPFPDKSFDVVSLIEVIEHLLPDDVLPALHELTRLARRTVIISAAVSQHWHGGVNLHPSARPEEEWNALFASVWGDKVRRVISLGQSPCWRVEL